MMRHLNAAAVALLLMVAACSSTSEPHSTDTTNAITDNLLAAPIIAPTSAVTTVSSTVQFTATTSRPGSTSFIWTSSDTTIAAVTQSGLTGQLATVTARKAGTAWIKVTAVADPTQSVSAILVVDGPYPSGSPTVSLEWINEVAGGLPANLASANGALAVAFSANWLDDRKVISAALIVHRAAGDTVVATDAAPTQLPSPGKWSDTLTWNTSARAANGAAVFANGSYVISVKALFADMSSESTPLTVHLNNP